MAKHDVTMSFSIKNRHIKKTLTEDVILMLEKVNTESFASISPTISDLSGKSGRGGGENLPHIPARRGAG